MSESRKPTTGFWITVALVAVLVGYPLSFGPACWWAFRDVPPTSLKTIDLFDRPVIWIGGYGPEPVRRAISWYMRIGIERGTTVVCFRGGLAAWR